MQETLVQDASSCSLVFNRSSFYLYLRLHEASDWRADFAVLFTISAGSLEYDTIYNVREASRDFVNSRFGK